MSRNARSQSDRADTTGDPPPIVKHLIWLLDLRNWRTHWKAIVMGAFLTGVFAIVSMLWNHGSKSSNTEGTKNYDPRATIRHENKNDIGFLPDDEARWAIGKALERGDVGDSRRLLSTLNQGPAKIEECEHVYDYTIKNGRLEEAREIVELCWDGELKSKKLGEISHEALKQK